MDSTLVPWEAIVKVGQKARRVWHILHNVNQAPLSWGKASETIYMYFNTLILNAPELEFFRYCKGNWKVTQWATKAYASWAHNYIKSKDALDTKAAQVNKQKRKLLNNLLLLQIDNDKNKDNVISQSPVPSHVQNASTCEAVDTPSTSTLVPTQVSSHHISRPRLTTRH